MSSWASRGALGIKGRPSVAWLRGRLRGRVRLASGSPQWRASLKPTVEPGSPWARPGTTWRGWRKRAATWFKRRTQTAASYAALAAASDDALTSAPRGSNCGANDTLTSANDRLTSAPCGSNDTLTGAPCGSSCTLFGAPAAQRCAVEGALSCVPFVAARVCPLPLHGLPPVRSMVCPPVPVSVAPYAWLRPLYCPRARSPPSASIHARASFGLTCCFPR